MNPLAKRERESRYEYMKYISHEWDNENDGVLFFIQRLEEMLFYYSDDIVRAPMHNTATLIREYIDIDKDNNVQTYHKKW